MFFLVCAKIDLESENKVTEHEQEKRQFLENNRFRFHLKSSILNLGIQKLFNEIRHLCFEDKRERKIVS